MLALVLTARILGLELGIARAVGAVSFSVVIGLLMHLIYRKEELVKAQTRAALPVPRGASMPRVACYCTRRDREKSWK